MNRLQAELHRLYAPTGPNATESGPSTTGLIDEAGRVRALVLELARPADWATLCPVWRGVQSDLGLPAPAIAVSGTEGLQLWFSLCEPVEILQAQVFLEALRNRYLAATPSRQVRLLPATDLSSAAGTARHAEKVPARQQSGNWSAFVAPDLAPLFSETPWLDIPPGEEGQAKLLGGLESIKPAMFDAALAQLTRRTAGASAAGPSAAGPDAHPMPSLQTAAAPLDPKRFLLAVMNDENVSLALRIEAAKALLPYTGEIGTDGRSRGR